MDPYIIPMYTCIRVPLYALLLHSPFSISRTRGAGCAAESVLPELSRPSTLMTMVLQSLLEKVKVYIGNDMENDYELETGICMDKRE